MLIKSEIYRILKSRRGMSFVILMFIIPFIDLILNAFRVFYDYITNPGVYRSGLSHSSILHPTYAAFLTGSSEGHIPQMLLIWILPLYLMIIYSDSYIQERKAGYNNILFSKVTREKLVSSRFAVSFLMPFIISFVSLTINFVLSNIIFHGGTDMMGAEYTLASDLKPFLLFCYEHPNLIYCVYIFVYSIIAGGCGIMCTGLSFIAPNYKLAYPLAFFLWLVQTMSHYSLTYAMQPFIEYGPEYFIPALIIFFVIVFIIMFITIRRKVGYDEL